VNSGPMVIVQGKMTNLSVRHVCVRRKANLLRFEKIFTSDFSLINYKEGHRVVNMSMMNGWREARSLKIYSM
jgi:hypothetical protein